MSASSAFRQPRFRLGAVIAIAVAAGLVAWLLLRDNGGSSNSKQTSATGSTVPGATAFTAARLARLARTVQHPIFWLGPKRGFTYEVTQTTNGKIYVRYLPAGVDVGSNKPYLTVATYPFPGAYAAISKQANARGAVTAKLANSGLAVLDDGYPESVHLAYPGVDYQVEVYDPTPAKAMQLVSAEQVKSLASGTTAASLPAAGVPTAASLQLLKALPGRLGHPVYWAGPRRGFTYELTTTPSGSVFIRYLPSGVKVGSPKAAYLTVATYPFPGAYAAVAKTAKGADTLKLARGGIAVVDRGYPKSIHLAYPGSAYQVEVFDPSPRAARGVVASGAIAPVR
jgi:hypothetical protein